MYPQLACCPLSAAIELGGQGGATVRWHSVGPGHGAGRSSSCPSQGVMGQGPAGSPSFGPGATTGVQAQPASARSAATSSAVISPVVTTSPSSIRHRRNGPLMSPHSSKLTGPITPS